jgi:tRNA (guanine37-N1)-methyltransferase
MTFACDVITIFPDMFNALTNFGVVGKAISTERCNLFVHYLRDFTSDSRLTVDDRPYGGGPGMIMLIEPLALALEAALARQKKLGILNTTILYPSPQGAVFSQEKAKNIAEKNGIIFICGRYEGIDERLFDLFPIEEISIGDYVLSGGELPTMCILDAAIRLIPGVLNDKDSAIMDSFSDPLLLDFPNYSKPKAFRGMTIPDILYSGNHALIHSWRKMHAIGRTYQKRPDLFHQRPYTQEESRLLIQYQQEQDLTNKKES